MNLCSVHDVRELLKHGGLRPSKRFGQNFLIDRNVLNAILRATELEQHENVLEIGPGLGCLSVELAQQAKRLICVEIDPAMVQVMNMTVGDRTNVEIINRDILRVDPEELAMEATGDWVLVGNLPYYITSPILEWLVKNARYFRRAVMMVQKEVADRLTATAGTSDYGSLTVYLSYFFQVWRALNVSRNVFYPAPDVDSAVIVLDTLPKPAVDVPEPAVLFNIIRAAFAMRRKTLENTLGSYPPLGWSKIEAGKVLEAAGIEKTLRGEKLSLQQFGEIARQGAQMLGTTQF